MFKNNWLKSGLLIVFLAGLAVVGGCAMAGVLASPSAAEMKLKAEYDLPAKEAKRILIWVEQPTSVGSRANIRLYISQFAEALLVSKMKLKQASIIPYSEVAKFREENLDYSQMDVIDIGKAMKADVVLYIVIKDFKQLKLGGEELYQSELVAGGAVYDVEKGQQVWPGEAEVRTIKVVIDVDKGGYDKGASVLAQSAVRCIIRYLYACPRIDARVSEEVNYNMQ